MVQAVIDINEHTNRVLNILKAKYGLRNKSEAINLVVGEYEENFLEPRLKPEYVDKIRRIEDKGSFSSYKSIGELRREIEDA